MLPFWICRLYCGAKEFGFSGTHLLPKDFWVIFKAEAYSGHTNGTVHSFIRKVTSFLLTSKEQKLACFQVGYPDWKSPLTLSFAPSLPSFWCRFLKKSMMFIHTGLHTHNTWCDRHIIYLVILFRFGAQGKGEGKQAEKTGGSSWHVHIKH